jgi:hypothetical protein
MKVIVQSVARTDNPRCYEIELLVGNVKCSGGLTLDENGLVWHSDTRFDKCLSRLSMAPRSVLKIVGDIHKGAKISFPVDLGGFEPTVPRSKEN